MLTNLKATTDLAPLQALSTLSEPEEARLARLNEDLARDPLRAAAEQRTVAQGLQRSADALAVTLAKTADEPLSGLLALADEARKKRAAAKLAAELAFGSSALGGVGDAAWRSLWEAARRYSVEVAYLGQPFPPEADGVRCVLCHQTLPNEARAQMSAFDQFIRADIETAAEEAERNFRVELDRVESDGIHPGVIF